jgi:hypothetical protein
MSLQIEDMYDAIPNRVAVKNLFYRQLSDESSRSPVLGFDGLCQLECAHFHEPILARHYPIHAEGPAPPIHAFGRRFKPASISCRLVR